MKSHFISVAKFIEQEINAMPEVSSNISICQSILHKVVSVSTSLYNKGYFDDESKIKDIIDNKKLLDMINKEIIIKGSVEEQKIINSLHSVFNFLYEKIVSFKKENNTTSKPIIIGSAIKEKFTKEICR